MKFTTKFDPRAQAELRAIELRTARRILAKLTELENDPYGYATTEIVTRPGVRRLRVGSYRIFYQVKDGELLILVVAVKNRSEAYD
jgi:mRNA interferase RelE/StbE